MSEITNWERLILDHISGLMALDKDGVVRFMNEDCADYLNVNRKKSMNEHIDKVFSRSIMLDILKGNEPINVHFYNTDGRVSLSTQIQLKEENQVVGVVEYDMIQDIEGVDNLLEKYNAFLHDEMDFFKQRIRDFQSTKYSINSIIGDSKSIQSLKRQIELAATSSSTVLITGETGTGKELVAHAIHNLSVRNFCEFIKVNSAGMPSSLIESELFGYEEGAFTGAKKGGKKGKFELADNGTLFIDEINQMPIDLQPKLLRVLQEGEVDRIGSEQNFNVDVRIIAATNEDLKTLVRENKFREDLFYRLNVFPIEVPTLRERIEDIPLLTMRRIETLNLQMGKHIKSVSPDVYDYLFSYDWPGNVRELYNVIERAMNMTSGETLKMEHFSLFNLGGNGITNTIPIPRSGGNKLIEKVKNNAEKELIIALLNHFGNNRSKVAKYLEIDRSSLYQKMRRLGIK